MMHSIRFEDLKESNHGLVLPTTVTFGAGLFPDGSLGYQSQLNAEVTAALHNQGLVRGIAITTGFGPDTGIDYPVTEAEGMANEIARLTSDNPNSPTEIVTEPYARDTLGSIWNLAPFLEEEGIEALTFVGAQYHVTRAAHMGKRIFGKSVEIVPVESCPVTSRPAMIKELGTTGLYRFLTFGAKDKRELPILHAAYRQSVKPFKKAVQSARSDEDGGRYGGSHVAKPQDELQLVS